MEYFATDAWKLLLNKLVYSVPVFVPGHALIIKLDNFKFKLTHSLLLTILEMVKHLNIPYARTLDDNKGWDNQLLLNSGGHASIFPMNSSATLNTSLINKNKFTIIDKWRDFEQHIPILR